MPLQEDAIPHPDSDIVFYLSRLYGLEPLKPVGTGMSGTISYRPDTINSRFHPGDLSDHKDTGVDSYFEQLADSIYHRAQEVKGGLRHSATTPGLEQSISYNHAVKDVRVDDASSQPKVHFRTDLPPTFEAGEEQFRDIEGVANKVRERLKGALRTILSDPKAMDEIQRELTISAESNPRIRRIISRLDKIRSITETPEEVERFLNVLQQAATLLGHPELKIQLLSSEDIVMRLCEGLYSPASATHPATAYLSMTRSGSPTPLQFHNVFNIFSDLLARHQKLNGRTEEQEELSSKNFDKLKGLAFIPKMGPDGKIVIELKEKAGLDESSKKYDFHNSTVYIARNYADSNKPKPKSPLETLYTNGKPLSTPNPEFVEALMLACQSNVFRPSDERRIVSKLPLTELEGIVINNAGIFFPPERLQPRNDITNTTRRLWTALAESIFKYAQDESFVNQPEVLQRLGGKAVKDVRLGYAVKDRSAHVYFSVDTAAKGMTPEDISGEVSDIVNKVKSLLKKAVEEVLTDGAKMDEIYKTIQVNETIVVNHVLKEEIKRLNYIRSKMEDPEEAILFLEILRQAIKLLGHEDLEVELLSTETALMKGRIGEYTHATDKSKAKISVQMSHYGTDRLLSLEEVWATLAHEIGHHDMAQRVKEGRVHGVSHDALTQENLKKLRDLNITLEGDDVVLSQNRRGEINTGMLKMSITAIAADLIREAVEKRWASQIRPHLAEIPGEVKALLDVEVATALSDIKAIADSRGNDIRILGTAETQAIVAAGAAQARSLGGKVGVALNTALATTIPQTVEAVVQRELLKVWIFRIGKFLRSLFTNV